MKPSQKQRLNAMTKARAEMQPIIAEQRISQTLRSKQPHVALYQVRPGQKAHVYREKEPRWHAPFEVVLVENKIIVVKISNEAKTFNKSKALPMQYHTDKELER